MAKINPSLIDKWRDITPPNLAGEIVDCCTDVFATDKVYIATTEQACVIVLSSDDFTPIDGSRS